MLLSDTTQLKSVAGIGKQLALTFKLSLKMGKSYKFCYFSGWDAYHATAAPQVRFLQETSVACCALSASHVSSQACLKLLPNEPKYVGESLFGSSNIMTQIVRHIAYNYSHFSPNQNNKNRKQQTVSIVEKSVMNGSQRGILMSTTDISARWYWPIIDQNLSICCQYRLRWKLLVFKEYSAGIDACDDLWLEHFMC